MAAVPRVGRAGDGTPAPPCCRQRPDASSRCPGQDDLPLGTPRPQDRTVRTALPQARRGHTAPRARGYPAEAPAVADGPGILDELVGHAVEFGRWAETTNVGSGTIDLLDDAIHRIAREYLTTPPGPLLRRAGDVASRVFELLQEHQRLRHTRDLYVTGAKCCAFLCLGSGRPRPARRSRSPWPDRADPRRGSLAIPVPRRLRCAPCPRPPTGTAALARPRPWPAAATRYARRTRPVSCSPARKPTRRPRRAPGSRSTGPGRPAKTLSSMTTSPAFSPAATCAWRTTRPAPTSRPMTRTRRCAPPMPPARGRVRESGTAPGGSCTSPRASPT